MHPFKKKNDVVIFPFEGNAHQGTIIEFPFRKDTWRENAIPARKVIYEMVCIISKYETVYLIVDPSILEAEFKDFIMDNVVILRLEYNDAWARDNTLIYLQQNGYNLAIDFRFNAWGGNVDGLYSNWKLDDALGRRIANCLNQSVVSLKSFILEGGSIHTDGEGTLLTTKACLMSEGRNPSCSMVEIENMLKKYLCIDKVLWLEHGIVNDETNEHIDNMACFLAPGVIAIAVCKDKADLQHSYSQAAIEYLKGQTDAKGREFKIIEIPVPTNLHMTSDEAKSLEAIDGIIRPVGNRLAASYINFYQSDEFVLVPQFGVKEDAEALQILTDFYKDKQVYPISSREILLGGGNIHCITMQIPKEK